MKSHKSMSSRNQVCHEKFEQHLWDRSPTKSLEQVYGSQMSQDSGGIVIPGNLTEEVTLNGTSMTEDDEGMYNKQEKYLMTF